MEGSGPAGRSIMCVFAYLSESRVPALRSSLLLAVAAALIVLVGLVSPVGDFPLNDDFVYAASVEALLERGELAPHPFSQALALVHTLWGSLFVLILGTGHTALRIATLVLAGVALWATGRCAEARGMSSGKALLCAGLLFCNPVFLNLSYTFMTDVAFLAPLCLAGLFYLRALADRRPRDLVWAGLMAVLATGIRQFGLALPLAFAGAVALEIVLGRRRVSRAEVFAFVGPLATGLVLLWSLGPEASNAAWSKWSPPVVPPPSLATVAGLCATHAAQALLYAGLFLSPLLWPLAAWQCRARKGLRLGGVLGLLAVGLVVWVVAGARALPSLPNVLYDLGAGPLTFRDFLIHQNWSANPVSMGSAWWLVTALAMATLLLLMAALVPVAVRALARGVQGDANESRSEIAQDLFLLAWTGIVLLTPYYLLSYNMFDRYLLPAIPPLAILAVAHTRWTHRSSAIASASCLAVLVFSVACLQNYMAWNHARWQGIEYLRADLAHPPAVIDGGYEFNGVHTSAAFRRPERRGGFYDQGPLGFWVLDDRYAVTMGPRRGFKPIKRIPYFSWLGLRERHLLVIERKQAPRRRSRPKRAPLDHP